MFKVFERWATDRRIAAYNEGFAWACTEHLMQGIPLKDIRDKIRMEFCTEFDKGAFEAVNKLGAAASALYTATQNYNKVDAEVGEYRVEIGRYQEAGEQRMAKIQTLENEIGHYRTALASIQTKCKTILHDVPTEKSSDTGEPYE